MTQLKSILMEIGTWIAITAVAFGLTFQFNEPLQQYRYGAAGWPRAIIYGIAFFALMQMLWRFFSPERKGVIKGMGGDHSAAAPPLEARSIQVHLKHAATFAAPLLYLYLMSRMGFYILTPFFIAGYMRLLGEVKLRHLVGTTLFIYALTLLIFLELLFVPLPVGNWPGFYEVSSLFVSMIK
jgi:hypothetical protein